MAVDFPRRHREPWSDDERAEAKQLHDSGLTWEQVAGRLGRTADSIIRMFRRQNKIEGKEPKSKKAKAEAKAGAEKAREGIPGWGPFLEWQHRG